MLVVSEAVHLVIIVGRLGKRRFNVQHALAI